MSLPLELVGVLLDNRVSNRSHCRVMVLNQRFALNAKPEATSS